MLYNAYLWFPELLGSFKHTTFSINKLNALETFHTNSLRGFLQVDKSTPNSILFLEFACTNIATLVV